MNWEVEPRQKNRENLTKDDLKLQRRRNRSSTTSFPSPTSPLKSNSSYTQIRKVLDPSSNKRKKDEPPANSLSSPHINLPTLTPKFSLNISPRVKANSILHEPFFICILSLGFNLPHQKFNIEHSTQMANTHINNSSSLESNFGRILRPSCVSYQFPD
jgi:hypothetical protein